MKAMDVMARSPVSVSPDTTLREVAELLIRNGISSVPVVDRDRRVIGIVTKADLFLKQRSVPFSVVKALTLFNRWATLEDVDKHHHQMDYYSAADVMSRTVHCADAEDDLPSVAGIMVRHGIKRVPVVSRGRLVGMVTRSDLICRIASVRQAEARPV